MHVLFFFMDGVGLGPDDPRSNPLAQAEMPNLQTLLEGRRLLATSIPDVSSNGRAPALETERASLLALDACMQVSGMPQSATGQATLLTGVNVPAKIGKHYGPKPNPAVAAHLRNGNLFSRVLEAGRRAALLNAYPRRYFEAIESGRRLYSAIPLAATSAGLALKTEAELRAGEALSADLTGLGWREQLALPDTPLLSPRQAGRRLAKLAQGYDLAFFEYWLSDYAGHRQDLESALRILSDVDGVLGGLLEGWDDDTGLILITSDHGNLEDLSTRRHTRNPAPALIIGAPELRRQMAANLVDLSKVTPAILQFLLSQEKK